MGSYEYGFCPGTYICSEVLVSGRFRRPRPETRHVNLVAIVENQGPT